MMIDSDDLIDSTLDEKDDVAIITPEQLDGEDSQDDCADLPRADNRTLREERCAILLDRSYC